MWIHDRLKPKNWEGKGYPFYAQVKFDGFRATFFKQSNGKVVAFGRDPSLHLEMTVRFPRLLHDETIRHFVQTAPDQSSLDCEIITNGPASGVPTALRDSSRHLKVIPFAVPYWGGKNLSEWGLSNIEVLTTIKLASWHQIFHGVNVENLLRTAKEKGIEGWVLKEANYEGWWKLKLENTIDCIVTDIVEGKGKYVGMIGALVVSVYNSDRQLITIANVSGMTDKQRVDMSLDDDLIGKVVEIKYQGMGSKGKLRHPRFKRFRPDKPQFDCILAS